MPRLQNHFDAVVIGGGIIGVSAAWQLTRRGAGRVAILEKGSQVADEREPVDNPDAFDTRASSEFRQQMMHKLHHRFTMKNRGQVDGL
jgi:glycine/D-amino acid oxidase-like deaminating enzyme